MTDEPSFVFPRIYDVKLPTIYDMAAGQVHRVTISLPLYAPQAKAISATPVMYAAGMMVDRDGIMLHLPSGLLREDVLGWPEAFAAAGLEGIYDGFAALAAYRLIAQKMVERKRGRGERGASKAKRHEKDFLLAECLMRMAKGLSQEAAVLAVLNDFPHLSPWSWETATESMLKMLKRHLYA